MSFLLMISFSQVALRVMVTGAFTCAEMHLFFPDLFPVSELQLPWPMPHVCAYMRVVTQGFSSPLSGGLTIL